jgi:O-antigen/teichoic acid export membrane protein
MSIKVNLILTYTTRIYIAVISVLIIPLIISAVGKDAYGLIGFFSVLQASLIILDVGVGGSLTRETARTYQNEGVFKEFNKLLKKIILFFCVVSFCVVFVGWLAAPYLATSWIKTSLPYETVLVSVICMFIVFSIRYMQGPFRSFIIGLEHHNTISLINFILATLSAPGSLILLYFTNNSIIAYFVYQALIALLILILYVSMFFKLKFKALKYLSIKNLNHEQSRTLNNTSVTTLKHLIIFSLQLSILSILWIIATQSDKLTLTKFLTMSEYSFYSIAVSIAAMISVLSDPISQILQPRLTVLFENKDRKAFVLLFVRSFVGVSIVGICLGFFFIYYGASLLLLWSGNLELSISAGKYVTWLIIGNVVAVMMNFIFILLYSYGQLKTHTLVYFVFCLFLIPAQIFVASNYLGEGSSKFYLIQSLLFFLVWGGYNLHKYLSSFITYFFIKFLIPCSLIVFTFYYSTSNLESFFVSNKLLHFGYLLALGVSSVLIALAYCHSNKLFTNTIVNKIKLKV